MKKNFKKNTLGEAFVLRINEEYNNDIKMFNSAKTILDESSHFKIKPFNGIEQVNSNLAKNPQYLNIPIEYSEIDKLFFTFPDSVNWDKYTPTNFGEANELQYWNNFEEYFTSTIAPFFDPLILVKARGCIYTLLESDDSDDYCIASFKDQKFVPYENSVLDK